MVPARLNKSAAVRSTLAAQQHLHRRNKHRILALSGWGSNGALPAGGSVSFSDGSGDNATLDLASFNATVGGLAVSPGAGTHRQQRRRWHDFHFDLRGWNQFDHVLGHDPGRPGGRAGNVARTVASGSLTLPVADTFSGNTTITGGMLKVTNSISSGNITVNAGGALAVAGGTLAGNPNLTVGGSAYFNTANAINNLNGPPREP